MNSVASSERPQDANDLVDRAWLVLFGACLCMFCATPGVLQFTFGVFAPEIARAEGWSPVVVNAAIGIGMLPKYILAPVVGYAIDRFGVRRIVLVGAPAYGAGIVLLGLLPGSEGQLVGYLSVACILGFGATPVLYAKVIAGWFVRRRGLAMGLVMAASSLGVSFWSPLVAMLLPYGWRTAYVALGLASGAIILFSGLFLLREAPGEVLDRKVSPAMDNELSAAGVSLKAALRTLTFWRITLAFALLIMAFTGAAMNLPIILRMNGLSAQDSALVISVVGISMLLGVLVAGPIFDRWLSSYVTSAFALMGIVAFTLLLISPSTPTFFVAAALIGGGLGVQLNAAALMVSFAFGARAYGALYGIVTLVFGVAGAISMALFGAALADGVPLALLIGVSLAILLPAILLLVTMRRRHLPYEPPKRRRSTVHRTGVENGSFENART